MNDEDILSKEEIEALLGERPSEVEIKGKVVRPYDFFAPERLSKENLRVFQILTEQFCLYLRKNTFSYLKTDFEINITSIKQTVFGDFLSLPSPTFIATFTMLPLGGTAAIEIDPCLLIFLIEYLLGGLCREKPSRRELTQVETDLALNFVDTILTCFRDTFEKAVKFEPKIDSLESNPQFLVIASPNEASLIITLELRLRQVSGLINICLPYLLLESLTPYLNLKKWFISAQRKSVSGFAEIISSHINNTFLNLVCLLGTVEISLGEICRLQKGDYIRLDKNKDGLLELQIAGLTKFYVQPGLLGRRLAVKIVSVESDLTEEERR